MAEYDLLRIAVSGLQASYSKLTAEVVTKPGE